MHPRETLKNVVDLSLSSVEVSVSTATILSGTKEVQAAATSMAGAVEELAASIGEIEGSAQRTSNAVSESSTLTHDGMRELTVLRKDIAQTGQVFDSVSEKTQHLQTAVSDLVKVVDLISKVAGQTNLLALNATIEAARAGEHGKGFAVVAGEVKSLSRQTSDATETIRSQIEQLSSAFRDVITSIETVQKVVHGVVEKTEKVSEDFEKISDNSNSITGQVDDLVNIISQQREAVDLLAGNMHLIKDKGDVNLEAVGQLADQTDHTVSLIEKWRMELANEEIEGKVLYLAQADHLLWKKKLLDMAVGRTKLKSSELADHTVCRLGKWYYGDDAASLRGNPEFKAIEEPHKKVHYHGIEAARCFERGQIDEGMAHYRELESASRTVIEKLQALAG